MDRIAMINRIGNEFLTTNVETGEYSYVQAAGSKEKLIAALGRKPKHTTVDIRMASDDVVVLIETKVGFKKTDEGQLQDYFEEEIAVHGTKKIRPFAVYCG